MRSRKKSRMLLCKCSFLYVLVKYRKDIGLEVVERGKRYHMQSGQ
jgi:hypothetical protein